MNLETVLASQIFSATPFRLLTFTIFVMAIFHAFLANHFTLLGKKIALQHAKKYKSFKKKVSFLAEVFYFLGEIEVIFALWVIPLMVVIVIFFSWKDAVSYLNSRVYAEPLFIIVMMSLSSTRPILNLARMLTHKVGRFFGNTVGSFWLLILILGPFFGSIITETAAMTIAALLLKEKIYTHKPSKKLAYATLGLLFANFSLGAVLTNFASPPAITLSRCWDWDIPQFFQIFGFRIFLGIGLATFLYYLVLRKDLHHLQKNKQIEKPTHEFIPFWVTFVHIVLLVWTVLMAENPPVFLGSYLLFLGFHQATRIHQNPIYLKSPLLVGLFLIGLIIHSGFQEWWIEPLIKDLGRGAMLLTSTALTAFSENATVAHLACFVDHLQPSIKYALASGLVIGGGLTVIAHAPNPVGQALLRPYFRRGISPANLFLAALPATLIFLGIFYFFPP